MQNSPALVTPKEITTLRTQLAEVADGKRFLLQGGDCAESFKDCDLEITSKKLGLLFRMKSNISQALGVPCISLGRIAGQYAKPRSNDFESINIF